MKVNVSQERPHLQNLEDFTLPLPLFTVKIRVADPKRFCNVHGFFYNQIHV